MAQTATNPVTGEKLTLQNGQWVPVAPANAGNIASAPRQSSQPRGIRNNNPGNVEDGAFARSLPGYAGSDGRFARFDTPEAGEQVAPRLLASYISRGYNTPNSIINRWAPLSDNNPTAQYASYVAQRAGVAPDQPVTEAHIPLIAAAIKEFENGQRVASQPAPQAPQEQPAVQARQIATNPQTGEQIELINGAWVPVNTVDPRSGAITVEEIDPAREARMQDPEYRLAFEDAQRGSANVPEALRAFGQGQTLGFLDEVTSGINQGIQGAENIGRRALGQEVRYGADVAAQAMRDSERDAQAAYARENPVKNFGLQVAGGLLTPGLAAGGNYIAGAEGTARGLRAAQVGAGYGAAQGFGNATGDIVERAPETAFGAGVGAATGYVGQRAVDRLFPANAAGGAGRASPARRLSREGVELTPGQMVGGVPVVGPVLRTLEEASSTIPFAGAAIAGARGRSVDTFNRAALNRVLEPLGEAFPTGFMSQVRRVGRGAENPQSGYEGVERVQNIVSRAYDRALDGIEVRPDQQFYDDLAGVTVDASESMTPQLTEQLANVLQNRVFRTLENSDSVLTGQSFKRAESELGALAREQRMSLDPANRALASALDDTRGVLRDLIARQRPDRADQIQAVNRAYSNLVPIEEAAGSTASQAAEGVFSPTQLAASASRSQTRSRRGSGQGRMQDLTAPAKAVLNSRIGDSGTATRGGVTALMSGGAGVGAVANPGIAIPAVLGVSAVYSRPVQAALNVVYRATDSREASDSLQVLARLAQRDPAIVPYYESAVQHVLGLSQRDRATQQPAPAQPASPSPALQRVLQP